MAAGLFVGVLLVALLLRLPADPSAGSLQEDLLLAATAVLAAAAGAALLLRHAISGRCADLMSGLAMMSVSVAHIALVQFHGDRHPWAGHAAPGIYLAGQVAATVFLTLRFTLAPIEPQARRIAGLIMMWAVLAGIGLSDPPLQAATLHDFALPVTGGGIGLSIVVGVLWLAVVALAISRAALREDGLARSA